jgi:hypothetical protein
VWVFSPVQWPQTALAAQEQPKYFERTGKRPSLVFLMSYLGQTYPSWHPVVRFLREKKYREVLRTSDYVVYRAGR